MMWTRLRTRLRLFSIAPQVQSRLLPNNSSLPITVSTRVHRFQEHIGGRPYLIEVAAVAKDRWRAYIVRIPGIPTALMPFYGPTPDEAADGLRQWLALAHERAAAGARRA